MAQLAPQAFFPHQELSPGGPGQAGRDALVVGDAAVNDSLPAGVDNDEGQVDDRVGRWRPVGLLLRLAVSLHQVLEGDLLEKRSGAWWPQQQFCSLPVDSPKSSPAWDFQPEEKHVWKPNPQADSAIPVHEKQGMWRHIHVGSWVPLSPEAAHYGHTCGKET
jgi:hypothetical protein